MEIATRGTWQHNPMPESRAELKIERRYTAVEYSQMKNGLVPHEMEDKWFIFLENNVLYFHRSWTGNEIYRMEFVQQADDSVVVKHCLVNRDSEQYRFDTDDNDIQIVCFLIDRLLLRKDVAFPIPNSVKVGEQQAYQHNIAGYGKPNQA